MDLEHGCEAEGLYWMMCRRCHIANQRSCSLTAKEVKMVLDSHNIIEHEGWLKCVDCHVRHRPRQRAKFQWCLASVTLPGPA